MDDRPIGVLDSGIGGITVLKELKKILPNENFVYLGDTKNFPYGEKSKDEIIDYTRTNIKLLLNENVKLVVIACGTATSQALDMVKTEFEIPIIGIIEPTVNYISKLKLNKIGVIATTGTIRSGVWEKKIKEKNKNINVINRACPLLASIAEEGKAKSEESLKAIHEYMKIFKEHNVDTIILGCTHYPIYNEIIKNEFEYDVNLINTGISVANDVKRLLEDNNMKNNVKNGEDKVIVTENISEFDKKIEKILKN